MVLERMGPVNRVFILGDYVKGIDSGRIEVVLEGTHLNEEYIQKLSNKIELEIQKKVVFYLTNQHDNSGLLVFEQELIDDKVPIL